MKIATKIFGEIEIADDKILVFPNGIIGFPDLNRFSLMYDKDKGSHNIQWLQSLDEPAFAMPVMDPLHVQEDYNPEVEDDVLEDVKPITDDNMLVLVTLTVPHDLTKMTSGAYSLMLLTDLKADVASFMTYLMKHLNRWKIFFKR